MVMFGGKTRCACRCDATFERIDPFFALAAKAVRSLGVAVFGAKIVVYANISANGGGDN